MRKDGWKGGNEKHKGANFLELQWKNSTEKGNDGNRRAKRTEYFINKEEAGVDSFDKEKRQLGGKSAGFGNHKGTIQIDINVEVEHK